MYCKPSWLYNEGHPLVRVCGVSQHSINPITILPFLSSARVSSARAFSVRTCATAPPGRRASPLVPPPTQAAAQTQSRRRICKPRRLLGRALQVAARPTSRRTQAAARSSMHRRPTSRVLGCRAHRAAPYSRTPLPLPPDSRVTQATAHPLRPLLHSIRTRHW